MTERLPERSEVKQTPSQIASSYFIMASQDFPASYHAQGAAIALSCQANGHNPADLLTALLFDQTQIDKLVGIANKTHESKGIRRFVDEDMLKRTLTYDFNMAGYLRGWDERMLRDFCSKYNEFHTADRGIDEAEFYYGDYLSMISNNSV